MRYWQNMKRRNCIFVRRWLSADHCFKTVSRPLALSLAHTHNSTPSFMDIDSDMERQVLERYRMTVCFESQNNLPAAFIRVPFNSPHCSLAGIPKVDERDNNTESQAVSLSTPAPKKRRRRSMSPRGRIKHTHKAQEKAGQTLEAPVVEIRTVSRHPAISETH